MFSLLLVCCIFTVKGETSYYMKLMNRPQLMTDANGSPIGDKLNILTDGPRGPALLQDSVFLEEMAHFDRERIPERVVHAKGAGAFGYFEVTHDVTPYCKSKLFSQLGKRTPVAARFSTLVGGLGSADTVRGPRGFALKFYTEEGNWDMVGLNSPIFNIQDTINFPSFIHAQKKNPVTNLPDPNTFWDFMSLVPETTHATLRLFSDRGIADGYRYMDGFSINIFKLVNRHGGAVYCKFIFKSDQGIRNLAVSKAARIAGVDPDYATRDLYNSIEKGRFPSWTFYIQVMSFQQADTWQYNPFDVTKIWPKKDFPWIEVGRFVLNRNPRNYFAEVEQLAFAPSHLVPGIEPSPDKLLQGRLFSYADTQRYRLGVNNLQIPVNCPLRSPSNNYERDGHMTVTDNHDGAPNYYPNSFMGPVADFKYLESPFRTAGYVRRYSSAYEEDNFTQAGQFYRENLDQAQQQRLVENLVNSLIDVEDFIQERAIQNFISAAPELGLRVRDGLFRLKMAKTNKILLKVKSHY